MSLAMHFYMWAFCLVWTLFDTGFSIKTDGDKFAPKMCQTDEDCAPLCHNMNELHSRCDQNGTCICDCSDPGITTSYTSACDIRQPDGPWRDYCDNVCRETYRRPCRFCQDSKANVYCSCVCNEPKPTTAKPEGSWKSLV